MKLRHASLITLLALAVWLNGLAAFAKKKPPAHPLDLNTATVKQLEQLPGVGPTTAKAIVEFRAKTGRFQRVTDLLVIRGVSETKLKKMRPYITVGPPPKNPPASARPATAPPAAQSRSSPPSH
ncbi:MAG TPA: helix-hairpin-helix domain-containing protein [Candidatus Acidoferrales bacterium]|jgi:competence ComEA-like helix-hairpin-helix protein|nr:helix-hairpin-helix domain-containing protein [Candidatus Acidoferrales bacterium]